ncbi:MAG: hypothetical protein RPU60_06555 [Candidatus Sedimenticola sp. (ex Thyasira tokunagai)]
MRSKSIILLFLVVCLAVYGGLKGYVHFKVKAEVDRLIHLVEPYVDIRYEEISSSFGGEVSVEGITVIPKGAVEVVRIGVLELAGDDFTFLLEMVGGLKADKPPEKVQVAARRIEIPVEVEQLFGLEGGTVAARPKPCTLGGILSHSGLENLDYQRLIADVRFGYRLNASAGELSINIGYWLQEIENFRLDLSFTDVAAAGDVAMRVMPRLAGGELRYQMAQDYAIGMVNYCAKQAGKRPSAYLDNLFSMSDQRYAQELGFVPGQGIRFILDKMIRQSAEVHLRIAPGVRLDLPKLQSYSPSQWPELLGLEVTVGERQVTDLGLTIPERGAMGWSSRQGDAQDGAAASGGRLSRAKPRFIETGVDRLAGYLGSDVRIYTTSRSKPKHGILNAVKGEFLEVEQRIHGGKMTMLIALDRVKKVEVLRRK